MWALPETKVQRVFFITDARKPSTGHFPKPRQIFFDVVDVVVVVVLWASRWAWSLSEQKHFSKAEQRENLLRKV